MPIHCSLSIRSLSADEFEQRDYRVMGHAYACQNELGRLCEEGIYEADLKARLLSEGFREVHTQVPVTVSHNNFSKTYYLDLIADDALYELKTNTALTGEDDAQLIHANGVAFRLTALTDGISAQESHLRRLLALTESKAMQWINLNHTDIQFVTLIRDGKGMGATE